jgi:hypothetical protein
MAATWAPPKKGETSIGQKKPGPLECALSFQIYLKGCSSETATVKLLSIESTKAFERVNHE